MRAVQASAAQQSPCSLVRPEGLLSISVCRNAHVVKPFRVHAGTAFRGGRECRAAVDQDAADIAACQALQACTPLQAAKREFYFPIVHTRAFSENLNSVPNQAYNEPNANRRRESLLSNTLRRRQSLSHSAFRDSDCRVSFSMPP